MSDEERKLAKKLGLSKSGLVQFLRDRQEFCPPKMTSWDERPRYGTTTLAAKRFPKFADWSTPEADALDLPNPQEIAEIYIFAPARKICEDLIGKNIPAAELTEKQKAAIFLLCGYMRYEDGKMVSIRPVGIADSGDGKYIVGIAPPKN